MTKAQAILERMASCPQDAKVQHFGCVHLTQLVFGLEKGSPVLPQLFKELRAPQLVATAMRMHGEVAAVQTSACSAVGALAFGAATGSEELRLLFWDEAVQMPQLVSRAMRQHPEVAGVQECACNALGQLAFQAAAGSEELHMLFWDEAVQMPQLVSRAMRQHPEVAGVQASACNALGQLAFRAAAGSEEVRLLFWDEAVQMPQLVSRAMRQHPEEAGVQEWACEALCHLAVSAVEDVELLQELFAAGVVPLLLQGICKLGGSSQKSATALQKLDDLLTRGTGSGKKKLSLLTESDYSALAAAVPLVLDVGTISLEAGIFGTAARVLAHAELTSQSSQVEDAKVVSEVASVIEEEEASHQRAKQEHQQQQRSELLAAAHELQVPLLLSFKGLYGIVKDLILPLADVVFDFLNLYSFLTAEPPRYRWSGCLVLAIALHSANASTAAWAAKRPRLAVANLLTGGTASQLYYGFDAYFQRRVKTAELLATKNEEAVESIVSWLVTPDSLAVAGVMDGYKALKPQALTSRWLSVILSLVCTSLLAVDQERAVLLQGKSLAHLQLRRDLTSWSCQVSSMTLHMTSMAMTMVSLPLITAARPYGGWIIAAIVLAAAFALHLRALLGSAGGLKGEWQAVLGDGLDVSGSRLRYLFTDNSLLRTSFGATWETATGTEDPSITTVSSLASYSSFVLGRPFEVKRLSCDVLECGASSYKVDHIAKTYTQWGKLILVRVETAKFFQTDGGLEHNLRCTQVAKRFVLSFITQMPLLIAVSPLGHTHLSTQRTLAWLRPLSCVAMWLALLAWVATAEEDDEEVQLLFANRSNVAMLVVSAVALVVYLPVAFCEMRRGRWGPRPGQEVQVAERPSQSHYSYTLL